MQVVRLQGNDLHTIRLEQIEQKNNLPIFFYKKKQKTYNAAFFDYRRYLMNYYVIMTSSWLNPAESCSLGLPDRQLVHQLHHPFL